MLNAKKPKYSGDGSGKMWPLSRSGTAPTIKSIFGPRRFASHIPTVGYDYDFHRGIDVPSTVGVPVYSPISGSVSRVHWTHFGWESDVQLAQFVETDPATSLVLSREVTDVLRMACSRVGAQTFPTNVATYQPTHERVQIQEDDWAIEVEFDATPSISSGGVGIGLISSDDSEYVALEYDGTAFTIRAADSAGALTSDGGTFSVSSRTWMRITYTQATDTIDWLHSTDGTTWTSLTTEATHSFTGSTLPVFAPILFWRSGDSSATPFSVDVSRFNWQDNQTIQRFGNWVEITGASERFLMIHFRDLVLPRGWVHAGELIGYTGATGFDNRSGRVIYPHLHLEYIPDNGYFYDNNDPINPLGPGVMPRTDVTSNVSVVRTNENDPDAVDSWRLQITVTRADEDFDLNSISLTGNLATRTLNFNTRGGLNTDNDVPLESGVYVVANSFDDESATYVLDVFFHRSVVGTTFTSYSILDTSGAVVSSE